MSGTASAEEETCRSSDCEGEPKWRWYNGMGAFAGYCDDCAREQLDDVKRCPITRREDVSGVYVVPAGIQPLNSMFPTIRTKKAFDTYLETDGEHPRQCRVSWCSNTMSGCDIHVDEPEKNGHQP